MPDVAVSVQSCPRGSVPGCATEIACTRELAALRSSLHDSSSHNHPRCDPRHATLTSHAGQEHAQTFTRATRTRAAHAGYREGALGRPSIPGCSLLRDWSD